MTHRTFRTPATTVRDPAGLARATFLPLAETPLLADAAAVRDARPAKPELPVNGRRRRLTRPDPFRYLLEFYREPSARLALLVSAILLAYGGGAVMFWFHAIYLGEGGPAISPVYHWLLDSTAGFIGLAPALAVILPLAARAAGRVGSWIGTAVFAIVGGTLFALVTGPGPVMHDALVGRGTWVADRVTEWIGDGRGATPSTLNLSPMVEMALQVGAGLVTYIPLMWLSLVLARGLARIRTPAAG